MKSLKRTLSLVLALVMVLGLFGGISMTAAATDFTDDESIQYKEAVDVVTGIGAINGYKENGEFVFKPGDNITRAEAAKMVAYTAITAQAGELLTGVTSSFSDVDATKFKWAIPSIEYLVKEGAINGVGGGKFEPNENITGFQVLKMLLCVLGYGEKKEYVGTGWDLQVAIDANSNKLTKGLEKDTKLDKPATREQLALYCFNALNAEVVTLSPITGNYVNSNNGAHPADTLGEVVYGLETVDAVITKNGSNDSECGAKGLTKVDIFNGTNKIKDAASASNQYLDIETGIDLIGHHVTVYYKPENGKGAVADRPLTAYAVVDKSTVVAVPTTITDGTDATANAKIKAVLGYTPTEINAAAGSVIYTVSSAYVAAPSNKTNMIKGGSTAASATVPLRTDANNITAFNGYYVFSGDQLIAFRALPDFDVSYVSAYTAPTERQNGTITVDSSTILSGAAGGSNGIITATSITIPKTSETNKDKLDSYAKLNIYDGIAKGDVILISKTGDFITVNKAESVTGTVTDAEYNANVKTITIDGEAYKVNATKFTNGLSVKDDMPFGSAANAAAMVNEKMVLYFDANGQVVVAAKAEDSVDTSLVYVVKAYQEQTTVSNYGTKDVYQVKLQCVNTAGEEVNYTVGAWEDDTDTQQASPTAVAGSVVVEKKDASSTTSTAGGMQLAVATSNSDNVGARDLVGQIISVSTAMDSGIKGEIATVTRATTLATAQSTEISVGTATGPKAATAAYIASKNYYTEDTQFIFVSQDGSNMKVTTATGAQAIRDQATAAYYSTKSANAGNFDVKYVFVNNKPVEAQSDDLLYVPLAFDEEEPTGYTDENNRPATAYKNTVYINGEMKKINVLKATVTAVSTPNTFYTYTVSDQGIYTLTAADTSVWAVGSVRNVYGSKITINKASNNGDVADVDTTGAFIVDPVYDAAIAADPKDTTTINHNSLAALMNDGTNAAKVAYSYKTTNGVKTITGLYYVTTAEAKETTAKLSDIIVTFTKSGAADKVYDVSTSSTNVSISQHPDGSTQGGVATLNVNADYGDLKGCKLSVKTKNDTSCKYGEVVSITDTGNFTVPGAATGENEIKIVMKTEAGVSNEYTTYTLTIEYDV